MLRPTIVAIAIALSLSVAGTAEARTAGSSGAPVRQAAAKLFEYPVPLQGRNWGENGIVAGPDNAMWFTAVSGNGKNVIYASAIVRVTNDQKFRIYKLRPQAAPQEIALGSDGALWFTESSGGIGRITTDGKVNEFALPSGYGQPFGITLGRDGALWFTLDAGIGRITINGAISRIGCSAYRCYPFEITTGPDGALWTTDTSFDGLDRFSPIVSSTTVHVNGILIPWGLTTGPDGALWICDYNAIDRYDVASGKLTVYQVPPGGDSYNTPTEIVTGSDGALWFTNTLNNEVDRVDTSGHFQQYHAPQQFFGPSYIASSPDGSLWFTNSASKAIGHIVFH